MNTGFFVLLCTNSACVPTPLHKQEAVGWTPNLRIAESGTVTMSLTSTKPHTVTSFAKVDGDRVWYPPED